MTALSAGENLSGEKKILLLAYGNPGRLDDGLGPAMGEFVEGLNLPNVTVDCDYQLTVEDAALLADCDAVIFADADETCQPPFYLKKIFPAERELSFSSHSVTPQALLALADKLFHASPDAFILGIRGYEFNEFEERISEQATENLHAAQEFFINQIAHGNLQEFPNRSSEQGHNKPDMINKINKRK